MNKLDQISWKRIATESAVIVGSILLAFAIDAWWDDRIERGALVEHLVLVETELVKNLEDADRILEALHEQVVAINRVLSALASDQEDLSEITYMRDLGFALTFISALEGKESSINALLESNQFRSIDNAELIGALNNVMFRSQWLSNIVRQQETLYYLNMLPMLKRHAVMTELGWLDMLLDDDKEIADTPSPTFSHDEAGMRSRESWNTIFNWKVLLLDFRNSWRRYKENSQVLLDEVKAELKRLK